MIFELKIELINPFMKLLSLVVRVILRCNRSMHKQFAQSFDEVNDQKALS